MVAASVRFAKTKNTCTHHCIQATRANIHSSQSSEGYLCRWEQPQFTSLSEQKRQIVPLSTIQINLLNLWHCRKFLHRFYANEKNLSNWKASSIKSVGNNLLFERFQLMMRYWVWLVWSVRCVRGVWRRGLVSIKGAAFQLIIPLLVADGEERCFVCEPSSVGHLVEQVTSRCIFLMGHWRTYQALQSSTEYLNS